MTRLALTLALAVAAFPALASDGGHDAGLIPVLLALIVILTGAKLGGAVAGLLRQPPVLGELLAGVLIGNAPLAGVHWFTGIPGTETIQVLAQLGVILLLFEVGMESTVRDMLRVGLPSFLVATLGVLAPFGLGIGVGAWLLPDHGWYVHVFIGATLTATSVGITARVLQDLGRSRTPEARVILGAAVIDDVMGLVILAVVSGVIVAADRGAILSGGEIALVLGKAAGFLVAALAAGTWLSRRLFLVASRVPVSGMLLATALSFCFGLSWLAAVVGLAPIVGAYAAGLILESVHFKEFRARGEHELEELVHPVASLLTPVFFVLMGMQVNARALMKPEALTLAAALTVAAIVGKQVCALGVAGRKLNGLAIGVGMVPRGEVGLIFANIGMGLSMKGIPVIDGTIYSAIVMMVIVTTLLTPPGLAWALRRGAPPGRAPAATRR